MATQQLVKLSTGDVHPAIMWGFAFMWEIRTPATMPSDLPRRKADLEKLAEDIQAILDLRQKKAPADMLECACDREVPGFSDLDRCPFCGVEYLDDNDEATEGVEAAEEADDEPADAEIDPPAPAPTTLVPMTGADLAGATVLNEREQRLEEAESQLAHWTTAGIRSIWERGRWLEIVRSEKLFTIRGCKTFQEYLDKQAYRQDLAYRYIGFYEACPEDSLEWCEGLNFSTMFALARQAKAEVEGMTKGVVQIHGMFRELVGEVQTIVEKTGRAPRKADVKQVVKAAAKDAAKKAGSIAAKVKSARGRGVESEEPRREGRPSTATLPDKLKVATPVVAKAVKLGLTNIVSPGQTSYINAKSGRPVARPAGNLVGRCIHLQGSDGKFLRIVLGHTTCTWTVEDAP